ncbi:uncharacterized protein LOC133323132 [Musca vetustissima]|uniref:uncharacterized protein LOC133323132 n=1 Tax=Musca vetustissima TaxID=27455 RepID=UPI002AB6BDCF|nr:uncharacterized protein LOC133323132 [Musca vetustissima]
MKFFVVINILILSAVVVAAQRSRQQRRPPARQGRTFGLLNPALNLLSLGGLGTNIIGYDAPISPYSRLRPLSPLAADPYIVPYRRRIPVRPLADPYYDDILYDRFQGYNTYGYKPYYGIPAPLAIRRPPVYGYPPVANPLYSGGSASAASAPIRPAASSTPTMTSAPAASSSSSSASSLSPAQAAQVANLLGQLLGQQLRPLVGGGSPAADTPVDVATSEPENSRRYF